MNNIISISHLCWQSLETFFKVARLPADSRTWRSSKEMVASKLSGFVNVNHNIMDHV